MDTAEVLSRRDTIIDNPELGNLKTLYYINMFLLITDFLMPQYFGVDVGYDITCTRFANILLVLYIFANPKILGLFSKNCLKVAMSIPLLLYMMVTFYTMVLRVDINAFMLVFLEVLTLYMLFFGIRFVIGIRKSFKIIIFCAYFLSIYGLVEYLAGQSLYLKFLRTVPTAVINCYRSGRYRIMGPCGHPLGYGLLLLLFIGLCCIDFDNDEIYLFKRPILLILLIVNVFLTGSRSTLAITVIEMIIILIFSRGYRKKKALWYSFAGIVIFALFVLLTYKTRIGRYILMQITSVIDLAFDTEISANFGADVTTLENSEGYREFLPLIFTLDWLNPLVGRGIKQEFGAEFVAPDGSMIYVNSVDNYYVVQYIKYAYPGLVTYVLFILVTGIKMIVSSVRLRSGVVKGLVIGFICYFFNLWYLDALQTLKFLYVVVALFFAFLSAMATIEKRGLENAEG